MKNKQNIFRQLFEEYGGMKRLLTSWDFLVSFAISIIATGYLWWSEDLCLLVDVLSPIIITIGAAMVAVVLAGLAIIVSLSDPDFVKVLQKQKLYDVILFQFWYTAIISIISIIVSSFTYALYKITYDEGLMALPSFLSIFFIMYAVCAIICIFDTTAKYGYYRGIHIEMDESDTE